MLPRKMGETGASLYLCQLKAMIKRNLLLKKREKRKTFAEVFLPLYSLGILIVIKILMPNPNFPEVSEPRGEAKLFDRFQQLRNHTIAVAPDTAEIQYFLSEMQSLWLSMSSTSSSSSSPSSISQPTIASSTTSNSHSPTNQPANGNIRFRLFDSRESLNAAYWTNPEAVPHAVLFHRNEFGHLSYEIRTNPGWMAVPSSGELYASPASCRESTSYWAGVFPVDTGETCPVNQYYYSGFTAIQMLIDLTKLRLDSQRKNIKLPRVMLEMFPKEAYTGNWLVAFRVVIPLYMVMALSQFITYLLILIVGEKEKKIKEGMKIMGLRDSVFWLSWFIIYAAFVLCLSIISTVLLFTLKVFQHTNFLLVFLLILLYSFSIIMFGFMLTPFFDKARTAGILGNFAVNVMSLLYFIQVFVDGDSSHVALWLVSLISSTGFALAMDRALVLELADQGVTLDNIWNGPGLPFGASLVMMAFDCVLYGCLAYYLDSVLPSEHGIKRKPWFCFLPSFWCKRPPTHRAPTLNGDSSANDETSRDIEPVARELKGREAIRIVDLCKVYHACRKPDVRAINGINLTIYEGQITAILGHNGAGKTSLFNILTGLTAPSSGTAFIFGYDIRDPNDMSAIRSMTGVCPQHDILFDMLTPREHLEFFAAVRGIPTRLIDNEVDKTLKDIDLIDKADSYAKHLSGGQKRKLSVGIAVIGDPKIIILDEPTAGVDPYSRRHMWSVLQNRRHGKVILLTTHFMDEADILADRKAVVARGRVRCCGTSLFLKNKFGIGYHLTLVLDGSAREHAISRLVHAHVPKAERARRHGRELSFILPRDAVAEFAPLFEAIESEIQTKANRLGICSYGVSMTTLEEVFLHLERNEDEDDEAEDGLSRSEGVSLASPGGGGSVASGVDDLSKKMVRNRALSRSLSLQSKSTSYQSLHNEAQQEKASSDTECPPSTKLAPPPAPIGLGQPPIQTNPNFKQTLGALVKIRCLRLTRDIQKVYLMLALPVGLAALGLYLAAVQPPPPATRPLVLDKETYPAPRIAIFNGTSSSIDDFLTGLSVAYDFYDGNYSSLLGLRPHMAALNIQDWDPISLELSVTAIYNDTAAHSLPIILNLISNTLYNVVLSDYNEEEINDEGIVEKRYTKQSHQLIVQTHPFQLTSQPEEFNAGTFSSALFIGMIFVIVPVSLAVDMVYDREIKAKNQLRVNGLSFGMYFLTYFLVLAFLMLIICSCLLGLIIIFDIASLKEPPAFCTLGILVLLYCPASILFATCVSYIFDKMDSAQSILPNVATFLGLVPFMLVVFLDMFQIGGRASVWLHTLFSLVNTMYIPYALVYYVDRVYAMCQLNSACSYLQISDYATWEIGVALMGIILHVPFWSFVLYILDGVKSGSTVKAVLNNMLRPEAQPPVELLENSDMGEHEDSDVRLERAKVQTLFGPGQSNQSTKPVVVVQNLRKEYKRKGFHCDGGNGCLAACVCCEENSAKGTNSGSTTDGTANGQVENNDGVETALTIDSTTKLAVRNLSFAVEAGEVFGLLGHNGAGKTTTMKIMIAEEAPTKGRVQIGGYNVWAHQNTAFRLMGYCPQHDAQWKNITVREHLECYAAIRGVPNQEISRVVEQYLQGLGISEHAGKEAGQCSGGTRRKLSFAMAMVGGGCVVLMDEPSAGLDPQSKRSLWDTILASFQGTRGAILTTHSMEEADALCSRVGIMVKGELRCIGSTQHLKNLYGAGYTLEMKLSGGDRTPTTPAANRHRDIRGFVARLFPQATLSESFADRLTFSVPQVGVRSLAECFHQLEQARTDFDIEEYSFSQTTLEQVFLKFAHYDQINDD